MYGHGTDLHGCKLRVDGDCGVQSQNIIAMTVRSFWDITVRHLST